MEATTTPIELVGSKKGEMDEMYARQEQVRDIILSELQLEEKIVRATALCDGMTSFRMFRVVHDHTIQVVAAVLGANKSLLELDLWNNSIGPEEAVTLADALMSNMTLQTLCISHNNIGTKGLTALADALKVNASLKTLDLEVNGINTEGASAIIDAIEVNHTLVSLKGIESDEIAEALTRNKKLAELGARVKAARA